MGGKIVLGLLPGWELQGRIVSPTFIRMIRHRPIAELFAARRSSVMGEFSMWHRRTGQHANASLAQSWCRQLDRLAARWQRKLEAETAAAEYQTHRTPSPPPSSQRTQSRPSTPLTWGDFYEAFKVLSDEEVEVALRNKRDCLLRAYVDYQDPKLKYGDFQFGGGITETFKARFVVLAMGAARNLSANKLDGSPMNVWLYHLFQDLLHNKSDLLFAPSDTGAIITRVCEASALYCLRLQAKVLESDQSTLSTAQKRRGRMPLRPDDFMNFAGTLWIQSKGTAAKVDDKLLLQIAARLDEKTYLPPTKYLERKYATELKRSNSKNSNSKVGAITTWSRLVQIGDKDQLRGMRRMLSRCASKTK